MFTQTIIYLTKLIKNSIIQVEGCDIMDNTNTEIITATSPSIPSTPNEVTGNTFKETLTKLLESKATSEIKEFFKEKGTPISENATLLEAVNMSLILGALTGNTSAYALLRDTIGEKPDNASINPVFRIEMPDAIKTLGE